MQISNTLPGNVKVISLPSFGDNRGSFYKLFAHHFLPDFRIHQVNSVSSGRNVLRGLHFQIGEFAEAKLFTVPHGIIQLGYFHVTEFVSGSIVIDNSLTALLVPRGFATGYLVLSDETTVMYFSDNDYEPTKEKGIRWNDPVLSNIDWQMKCPIVSKKDQNWPDFQ